ncbi:hypothetical protein [Streptomyces sp. NBC_00343]|uniref:hypothetical protein n=1 Tax=Streptomyces sp. NBC_00343 TaxID=2975719 RepID=UPI002E2C2AC6|nr:hypothetical protein [Streptomyces sp. NBC_00343]
MADTEPPTAYQDQARHVQDEITKLIGLLPDAEPHQHLRTAADLRTACDQLLASALVSGMVRAREEGWGLRRIAASSRYSHEQVRTLLAARNPEPGIHATSHTPPSVAGFPASEPRP